jgi:hypothetical protein
VTHRSRPHSTPHVAHRSHRSGGGGHRGRGR